MSDESRGFGFATLGLMISVYGLHAVAVSWSF